MSQRKMKRALRKPVAIRTIRIALSHLYQYWDWANGAAVEKPGKSKAMMTLYAIIPGMADWPMWAKELYLRHVSRLNFLKSPLPNPLVPMPATEIYRSGKFGSEDMHTWIYKTEGIPEKGVFILKEDGKYVIEASFSDHLPEEFNPMMNAYE